MFLLRYDEIVNDVNAPAFIRMLAVDLQKATYMMPGKFFENLADRDLKWLADCVEKQSCVPEDEVYEDARFVLLLGAMLASSEGAIDITEESIHDVYVMTSMFIVIESLYRAGFVDAYRDNYSYIDVNAEIAKLK